LPLWATINLLAPRMAAQIKSLTQDAIKQLLNSEASLEVNALLQHALNVNRAWLILHADDEMSEEDYQIFQALLKRRLDGEPIAYILGEREFYGLPLKVTADTLIPRPDTETLVEVALGKVNAILTGPTLTPALSLRERELGENDGVKVLDLGTGTGAIALAIAKNSPNAQVTAVDFSTGALAVAKENAENLNIKNVQFLQSNWFEALANQRFDMIVSNPPYIEDKDPHLSQGDLRFEPRTALA